MCATPFFQFKVFNIAGQKKIVVETTSSVLSVLLVICDSSVVRYNSDNAFLDNNGVIFITDLLQPRLTLQQKSDGCQLSDNILYYSTTKTLIWQSFNLLLP